MMSMELRFITVNLLDEIEVNFDFTAYKPELHGLSNLKDLRRTCSKTI